MGINDLPSAGITFRATTGAGNFQRKLSGATRYGDLKNLRDNQKAIVDVVGKHQGVIRTKGGLSRLQRLSAWHEIQAKDRTITKEDRREIKEVLKHLGRGAASEAKKMAVKPGAIKASDGKSYLTPEQIKRNLGRAQAGRRYEYGAIDKGEMTQQYGGGDVKSFGVVHTRGSAGDIGIDRERAGKIGFAGNFQNNKLPGNSAPKMPPGGIKPIGNFMNN